MAQLLLSAFSDEYADNFNEQCEALAGFGIKYLELRHADGKNVSDFTKQDVLRIKSTLNSYGLKVSSVGSPLGKTVPDGLDAGKTERIFETAAKLGAERVRVFSFYLPEGKTWRECRGEVFSGMEKIVSVGEKYGILPCHENEAGIYGESPQNCLELIQNFGGKLGCVFDMGNFVLDGFEAWEAYSLLKEYISYFHIKDALPEGAVVPPGKGKGKIKDILEDYRKQAKQDVLITLEPHLQTFSGLNALVGKTFENPYKYHSQQEAFSDAVRCIREII